MYEIAINKSRRSNFCRLKQFCEMIDTFMDNGFTYFDTAYPYHQRQSELFVKKALV